jgi:hypothetical protein
MLPFFFFQATLHREIKLFFLLILRKDSAADLAFYIIFFPGILMHESSHWLMARLMRVPTGRFSLIPRTLPNGKLRLGYVETRKSDWFRDSLIGAAPLLSGCLITIWLANYLWNPMVMASVFLNGDFQTLWQVIIKASNGAAFWVCFYLVFVISSIMLPSESDRKSWLPVLLIFIGLILILLTLGVGNWMQSNLIPILNPVVLSLTVVFAVSLTLHIILLIPIWLIRASLVKLVGYL